MLEQTIIANLLTNEPFTRKVIPFLKSEYFQGPAERILHDKITTYFNKYNVTPTLTALGIELENDDKLTEEQFSITAEYLASDKITADNSDLQWLIDQTEEYCQARAVYLAIMESISILDGKSVEKSKTAIPSILSDALAVSFDINVGHDFLEDADQRWAHYHRVEEKIPFDIEVFNKITRGGTPRKTLNIILAGVHVGKTLSMCHMAAYNLLQGKNVLYISMEMGETEISQRIDCNLMDIVLDDLEALPRDLYLKKINNIRGKAPGKLIVKQFPTAMAGAGHFRHLMNELRIKKQFIPDVVYIDYINICASMRVKLGSNMGSYGYIKAIAEELRGLAIEKNVVMWSATQVNRSGFTNSDIGLEDTAESFGLPATADFMIAGVRTEELDALGQIMFKQLKNRYADANILKRFVVGVDLPKFRLHDVDNPIDGMMNDDRPVMDKSKFGEHDKEDTTMKWSTKTRGRKDFTQLFEG